MSKDPEARQRNLTNAADASIRLRELFDDPEVKKFFTHAKAMCVAEITKSGKAIEDLRDTVAMLRALEALEVSIVTRVKSGEQALKKLQELVSHD